MEAARKRGLTWAQITALLEAEGTRAADGSPLTVNEVRALFHSEKQLRLSREERRKVPSKRRGSLGPLVITPEPPAPPEAAVPEPQVPQPPNSPPDAAPAPAPTKPTNRLAEVTRPKEGLPVVPPLRISETGRD